MKRLRFLGIMVLGLFLAGCDDDSADRDNNNESGSNSDAPTKIVVISDSIGTGFGVATGFPVFLESLSGAQVINNSSNGRMSAAGIGLASSLISQHNPTHLVVLLGTNDALRGSVSGAVANLQRIADIGNAAGVTVVIGTLPPITRNAGENSRAAQISSGIAGINGARIAGIRADMNSATIADGVHPNNDGQRIIAVNFNERL